MSLSTLRARLAGDLSTMPSISQIRDDMNRFIDTFALRRLAPLPPMMDLAEASAWMPAVDLSETDTDEEVDVVTANDSDLAAASVMRQKNLFHKVQAGGSSFTQFRAYFFGGGSES